MPSSSIKDKYPPGLVIPERVAVLPIAFISNGEFSLTSFIVIIAPLHVIAVVKTILCPFIEIASAPVFFNSLTICLKSSSCTKLCAKSIPFSFSSLSLSVNVIPEPTYLS